MVSITGVAAAAARFAPRSDHVIATLIAMRSLLRGAGGRGADDHFVAFRKAAADFGETPVAGADAHVGRLHAAVDEFVQGRAFLAGKSLQCAIPGLLLIWSQRCAEIRELL
jgi:hypothetical protein